MRSVEVLLLAVAWIPLAMDPTPPPQSDGQATSDSFVVSSAKRSERSAESRPANVRTLPEGPVILLGSQACDAADGLVGDGGTSTQATFCPGADPTPDTLTISDVRNAFARLPLPASRLVIQPPDGLTLVNFDTNFYTPSTEPVTRTVTLLGQRVTIEATPSTYHWRFGDGHARTTEEPGAAYPDLTITHRYARTGRYPVSLATTYAGRYRVGTGAWQSIPGTVTITGEARTLRAIEAQPRLVGH